MTREIKLSEARILVFLSTVKREHSFALHISNKLDIDYSYCMQILNKMLAKGWLAYDQFVVKKYYKLKATAPLEEAKQRISR